MKTHQETLQENETLKRKLSEAQETIELVKSQLTRALEAIVADETMPLDFEGKRATVFTSDKFAVDGPIHSMDIPEGTETKDIFNREGEIVGTVVYNPNTQLDIDTPPGAQIRKAPLDELIDNAPENP